MTHPMSTFPDRFRLDGRTALITGSGRGLGWEMAKGLAEAGARVLLHGRSHERLAPRLSELAGAGHAADAICFDMADRAIARDGYRVSIGGKFQGRVTSGSPAPYLKKNIGMAYVPPEHSAPGGEIQIEIRGKLVPARVVSLPFYKRPK